MCPCVSLSLSIVYVSYCPCVRVCVHVDALVRDLCVSSEHVDDSLPSGLTIWDYLVDKETGSWVKWQVPDFQYQKGVPFFSLVVPTVDSTRLKYVLRADVEGGFHALIGGNSGVGKTLTVLDYLDNTGEELVYQAKSFSAQV